VLVQTLEWRKIIMSTRYVIWGGLVLAAVSLAGFGAWVFSLPPASASAEAPSVAQSEMDAMLASLKPAKKPAKRDRPLVAVVGINDATETTDYLVPTGILRRADVADVVMLATGPGPVRLYPALTVEPDATIAEFDARNPDGADYVIVPAMNRDDDPAVLAWLKSQAAKGATIIGICAGAKVVGAAGLLDGKRATTHWYYLKKLLERSPSITYVPNRRMVVDGGVATTTGISASMPMMLTLIEAIAGREKAEAVARDLGLPVWNARHASDAFKLTRPFATTVLVNKLSFWDRNQVGVQLQPGMDEVSLALVADAWSRTYRSNAVTFAASKETIVTRNGIRIVPDQAAPDWAMRTKVSTFPDRKPADALDQALTAIGARYGDGTTNVVAMQLEYPR
jgi:putative intracellular protease/amidase